MRATRRTRDGRPPVRRAYALTMLHCSDCGRHLIGDTGRYRHPDACEAFTSVRREPRKRLQGQRRNMPGASYRADEYEAIVREVLADVSLGAEHIAAVVGETRDAEPDRLAIARIGRERDAALARYRRDRDLRSLERTMASLDEQEAEANAGGPVDGARGVRGGGVPARPAAAVGRRARLEARARGGAVRAGRGPGAAPDADRADAVSSGRGPRGGVFTRICWLWSGREG